MNALGGHPHLRAAARIGQAVPFVRDVCRSACPMYETPSTSSRVLYTLGSGSPIAIIANLPGGWTQVQVQGFTGGVNNPSSNITGFIRTILLKVPGIFQPGPMREPGNVPNVQLPRPPSTTPPGSTTVPPSPPPDSSSPPPPPTSNTTPPPIADTSPGGLAMTVAAPSIAKTVGELLLLTSPAWGALLLSRLLR